MGDKAHAKYNTTIPTRVLLKLQWLQELQLSRSKRGPLDRKEIQLVHPKDQSWVFIGRTDAEAETPILWPPDVKS